MDETQKRKLSAKEFIEKNRNIGYAIGGVFVFLLAVYFGLIIYYSLKTDVSNLPAIDANKTATNTGFFENLLPVFTETDSKPSDLDTDFLSNFASGTSTPGILNPGNATDTDPTNDSSKLLKIETKPILGYVIFDQPISIKNFIKIRPKICENKLEVVTVKDSSSPAVKTFQNLLHSMEGYEKTPDTGSLDEATREQLYIFQTRYADVLYRNKKDKTPTRVIDAETAHFLNLLCGLDKETQKDFIPVPTLRYSLQENREIYDYNTLTKEKIDVPVKNATGTHEAIFSPDGAYVVFRSENDNTVETKFYNVRTKNLTPLENNIWSVDFNSKGQLVYSVPGDNSVILKIYDYKPNKVTRVAEFPLREWNSMWLSDTEIGLYNKPTGYAEGIYLKIDINTKKVIQLAGPLTGLSVQKTNLKDFNIISTGGLGASKALLLNNNTRTIGDLGLNTFAEKCAQTIFANGIFCAVPKTLPVNLIYPDDWYKGRVVPADVIAFKTISGTTTKIISYLENRPISIVNLQVNKNGIFFMDENTLSLYSLQL